MEKIVLILQSFDYPVYTIDEETGLRIEGLPKGFELTKEMIDIIDFMQKKYNEHFKEDEDAMTFIGFKSREEKIELENKSIELEKLIKDLVPEYIAVENKIPAILLLAPIK